MVAYVKTVSNSDEGIRPCLPVATRLVRCTYTILMERHILYNSSLLKMHERRLAPEVNYDGNKLALHS